MLTEPPDGVPVEPPEPPAAGSSLPPPEARDGGDEDGRIIAGVALEVAARLGVDPLWVRLSFVALALASGLGVVIYVGLWLILIVGRRPGWGVLRWVGAGVLLVGAVLLLDGHTYLVDGPLALAAALVAVAVALWQPRVAIRRGRTVAATTTGAGARERGRGPRTPRERQPSLLGRATLGVAIVVAAVGVLIDQLNGGRLHPEQWLGVAAAVCGAGLALSAWRGRALWLIVPGLAFAGAGYLAGHAARAGVQDWGWGHSTYWIGPDSSAPTIEDHLAGDVDLDIAGAPESTPFTADLRLGIGDIEVTAADGVTVEIRPHLSHGEVVLDGVARPDGDHTSFTIGPEGRPDVIVEASISTGDLFVDRVADLIDRPAFVEPVLPVPPWLPADPEKTGLIDIGEGLTMASDGTVLMPDGVGAIGPNGGQLWVRGDQVRRDDGVIAIVTPYGDEYLVLPNQMIITPSGTLIDVPARRQELREATTSTAPGQG